jgi:hypothetical protein
MRCLPSFQRENVAMTSQQKLWLTIGLGAFAILHLWGASMIAAANVQDVAPISFANTGD